jgi:serine phosphatase RsbU (regulator of sigma subunit)
LAPRLWTGPRKALLAAVVGVGVPFVVALVVPHDVHRINIAMAPMLFGVVFAALVSGLIVGVVASLSSAVVLSYWFFPPRGELAIGRGIDVVSLGLFLLIALGIVTVLDQLMMRAARETEQRVRSEAELESEQRITRQLQLAILPAVLPRVPGVEVATRYVGATDGRRAGGDWYAVVPVGCDGIALAIGDVAGHGVGATAVMAQMRHALRAFATIDPDPSRVLERLNQLLLFSNPEALVSVVYGVLDVPNRRWHQANAGHCLPAIRDPDATVRFVEVGHGPMLGLAPEVRFPSGSVSLTSGSALALYTDGLIERRGEMLDIGMERLAAALCSAPDDPESTCDAVLDDLDARDSEDDVALVLASLE